MKAQQPQKSTNVCDGKVSDYGDFLSRRIRKSGFGSMVSPARLSLSDTATSLHDERLAAVLEEPELHVELYQRAVVGGKFNLHGRMCFARASVENRCVPE